MTSAGAAEVLFSEEDTFTTLPGTPTWYQPGENLTVESASLDRALNRARSPDDPRPSGSREGNREVALSVSFSVTDTNWHPLVFAGSSALASSASLAPTSSWYLSADTLGGEEERFIQGAAVESFSLNYSQGEDVTVDLTLIGAEEVDADDEDSPSVPSSPVTPSKDDIATFAGFDFDLNGSQLSTKLQSVTLEVSGMARFRRGQQQTAVDAVVGAYEPSLSVEATLEDGTQRELAYGTSGATQPQDTVDSSAGEITVANPGGTVATYTLSDLQPTSYSWNALVEAESDITEPVDYHLTDVAHA
jgi:hypothetical protein